VKRWWLRPLVRFSAAVALPVAVPFLCVLLLWALPGDPASIICPPETCSGTEELARRWQLDQGPLHYFTSWVSGVFQGDWGNSWRVMTGLAVRPIVEESLPNTLALLGLAAVPVLAGAMVAALEMVKERVDPFLQVLGAVPGVLLALVAAAWQTLRYGPDGEPMAGLLLGAAVLGLADGVLSGSIIGTRGLFSAERKQRYTGVAILRGETVISNTLPNVAPAFIGQLRARGVQLLSGAVVIEVVLRVDGLGDLLWQATLAQDFGLVMPVVTLFALLSASLLFVQALGEVAVALHVRRSPDLGGSAR
jgi:peptide/nickel transport system permease protein